MTLLFQDGDFTSHAGLPLAWKIECDAITDDEWRCLAKMVMDHQTRPFYKAVGIPRGGLKFAEAMNEYASGNDTNTFGYANDGRFAYDGSIGFIRNNFGAEIKYISLGSQKQISQNGASLGANETGTYDGSYYGLSGKYFVPLNQGKQDLHLSLGGGRLSNTLSSSDSNATTPASNLTASQNEWALLLGAGIRFNLFKNFGFNVNARWQDEYRWESTFLDATIG